LKNVYYFEIIYIYIYNFKIIYIFQSLEYINVYDTKICQWHNTIQHTLNCITYGMQFSCRVNRDMQTTLSYLALYMKIAHD